MEHAPLGQRVTAVLLPRLAELTGRREGGRTVRDLRGGRRRVRRLWSELEPHVRARPELAEAVRNAVAAPALPARQALAAEIQALLDDDPRVAIRVRGRMDRIAHREALRDQLAAASLFVWFGLAVIVALVAAVLVSDAWLFGEQSGVALAMAVPALAAVLVTGLLVYRRFPRAINWLLVAGVVVGTLEVVEYQWSLVEAADTAKTFGVFVLTLVPGWLYMRFVAARGRSLWEAYVTNLFRLRVDADRNLPEPPPGSVEHERWTAAGAPLLDDPGVLYRRRFEAAYASTVAAGEDDERAGARVRGEGFSPVWIMTLLTAFGWVAVLIPTFEGAMVFGSGMFPPDAVDFGGVSIEDLGPIDDVEEFDEAELSDPGTLPDQGVVLIPPVAVEPDEPTGDLVRFPLWEALAFGFVGAYWFNLQSLVRRYFQNDLRTNAYISAIVRYVVVAVLVAVLFMVSRLHDLDVSGEHLTAFYGLAFVIGVFPIVGLQLIMKAVTKVTGLVADLGNQFPLTHLDGLNMWYEARLLEEGVEDLANLASADIVDLLLATRVPVGRTVDWIDQAQLYLRVTDPGARERLRTLGIRTATDLQDVFAGGNGPTPASSWPERAELVARVLHPDGSVDAVNAVDTVLAGLEGEPNLRHVRAWREFDPGANVTTSPGTAEVPGVDLTAPVLARTASEGTRDKAATGGTRP